MVDKSLYPCRHCGHPKHDHGRNFDICYACHDNKQYSGCRFERIANLEFLECLDKKVEKESKYE